jgi:hypothetical protein
MLQVFTPVVQNEIPNIHFFHKIKTLVKSNNKKTALPY